MLRILDWINLMQPLTTHIIFEGYIMYHKGFLRAYFNRIAHITVPNIELSRWRSSYTLPLIELFKRFPYMVDSYTIKHFNFDYADSVNGARKEFSNPRVLFLSFQCWSVKFAKEYFNTSRLDVEAVRCAVKFTDINWAVIITIISRKADASDNKEVNDVISRFMIENNK